MYGLPGSIKAMYGMIISRECKAEARTKSSRDSEYFITDTQSGP